MYNRDNTQMIRSIFDALPSIILVVDDDVRIQAYNRAAAEFLLASRSSILKHRGGEVLHCLHSTDEPDGCGHGAFCKDCIIRRSVTEASEGKRIARRRAKIDIIRNREKVEIYALVTANPFSYDKKSLVLLVIEDISEIAELQRMIPICSICAKIRDDKESWSRIESYFKEHWDVDFSHSLCPECYQAEMEKLDTDIQTDLGTSDDS